MSKSVLVTGASRGIGRACAEAFAAGGYTTFATMRDPAGGEELAAKGKDEGWDLQILQLDVTDQASIDEAFTIVHDQVPALDALVNNAGMGMQSSVEEATDDEVLRLYDTNILGIVRVSRAALPKMRERGEGALINISSMGGHVVWPYFAYYHSTKFALEALTEGLYLELAPFGIRVYAVMPGLIDSDFGQSGIRGEKVVNKETAYRDDTKRWIGGFVELVPDNRVGPETVGAKAFELAESDSTELHHASDPFADMIVTNRKEMTDAEWFAYFRGLHGLEA